ncbi:hypothetical protein MishRS11D_37500 [Methylomagnum ishizawai]|nr:hypothetical protein MishRS11D_37500 [Methylomagnum ishizawai]
MKGGRSSAGPDAVAHPADVFAQLGLMVFALLAFCAPLASASGLGLVFLAALFSPGARQSFRRDPLLRCSLALCAYLAVEAAWAAIRFPETWLVQLRFLGQWTLCLGFPALAWVLQGRPGRVGLVLVAAFAGLVFGAALHLRGSDFWAFRVGQQTGFQMRAGCAGLVWATALLGLLLYAEPALRAVWGTPRLWPRLLFFGGGLYLAVYALVASQSRISWIALALAVAASVAHRVRRSWGQEGAGAKRPYILVLALVLVGAGIALNTDRIGERIAADRVVVAKILGGDTADLPLSSFKYRYYVQRFGLEKWWESPWFGWGPGSTAYLIKLADREELVNQTDNGRMMGQLHNTYLEILMQGGIVGLGLFLAWAAIFAKPLCQPGYRDPLPEPLGLFVLGGLSILAIWGFAAYGMIVENWPYWRCYWLLLAGIAHTFVVYPPAVRAGVLHI